MSIGTMHIEISLDNMQFSAALRTSEREIGRFVGNLRDSRKELNAGDKALRTWGNSLRDSVTTLALARRGAQMAWDMVGSWGKAMVGAAAQFERAGALLAGMSDKAVFIDKLKDGKDQLNQITDLAKKAPFSVSAITDAWVKFKSAGLDPANGSLQSLIDATAAFGGTDDVLHRASVAIQQMAGKGVISMEELRQQLGEAVPTAMKNMADGMGVNMARLTKEVSKGTVEARDALSKMFREFGENFGGKASTMMDTFNGKIAVLKTSWTLFASTVAEKSGLFATSKTSIEALIGALDNKEVQAAMVDIAHFLAEVILKLRALTEFLWDHREAITNIIKIYALWKISSIAMMSTFSASMTVFGAGVSVFKTLRLTLEMFTLFLSTGFLSAIKEAAKYFSLLIGMTPAGWAAAAVTAIAAVIGYLVLFKKNTNEATEHLKEFWATASDVDVDKAIQETDRLMHQIDTLSVTIARAERGQAANGFNVIKARERLAALRAELEERQRIIGLARNAAAEREQGDRDTEFQAELQAEKRRIQDIALMQREAFRKELSKTAEVKKLSEAVVIKQLNDYRIKLDGESTKQYVAYLAKRLAETEAAEDKAAGGKGSEALARRAESIRKQIEDEKAANKAYVDTLGNIKLIGGSDKNLPIVTWLAAQEAKIASLRAKLAGEVDQLEEVAAFDAMIDELRDKDNGNAARIRDGEKLVTISEAEVRQRRALVQTEAELKNAVQAKTQEVQQNKYALDRLRQSTGETTAEYKLWLDALMNGGVQEQTSELREFTREYEKLYSKFKNDAKTTAELDSLREKATKNLAGAAYLEKYLQIQEEIRQVNQSMITDFRARFEAEREEARKTNEAYITQNKQEADRAIALRGAFDELWESKRRAMEQANDPIFQLAASWQDKTQAMREATASWLSGSVDAIADFAETGKLKFGDFAKSILKDLLKIILRAQIANALMGFLGSATAPAAPSGGFSLGLDSPFANSNLTGFANGGVMSKWGSMALNKYANGGIANRPQVAVFGEGSKPEAYVPLPDGRSIPVTMDMKGAGQSSGGAPNIAINLINQSGNNVQAEQQGSPRFDGKGYVLDIVLKGMASPGSFRDGMRQAVK